MTRVQLKTPPAKPAVSFIPSGGTMLDLVLGGGWAEGRVSNIVGDRSAGKTLLAIEACANFAALHGAANIRYAEAEAAFDISYARTMGMPEGVSYTDEEAPVRTVEDLNRDITQFLAKQNGRDPCLYILDSLDALSDDAEMGRELGEATYGTGKAKAMSELFRRQTAAFRDKKCSFIVISQIRDKIGVTFGETKTRSGGRALDFYCSQVVWLAEIKKLERTVTGVKRMVGVQVEVRNKKNKVGKPFRRAEFSILFNYGIDDELSMLDWLAKNGGAAPADLKELGRLLTTARTARNRAEITNIWHTLNQLTTKRWNEIENALEPPMRKYS